MRISVIAEKKALKVGFENYEKENPFFFQAFWRFLPCMHKIE